MRIIHFSTFNSARDNTPKSMRMTWPELVAYLQIPRKPLPVPAGDDSKKGMRSSTNPRARAILQEYLNGITVNRRARLVSKIGWTPAGAFVLPGTTIGGDLDEETVFQGQLQNNHAYRMAGSLDDWQINVGRPCLGNSRLVTALSTALACPLLGPLQMESGGLHFKGNSSTGKSTSMFASGSFWGGGDPIKGFLSSWRATSNGLEGTALGHNDCLLLLDEIGEIDGAQAGVTAYMLANGQQKNRARSDGSPRPVNTWNVLFLSSGEQSLADKMAEVGHSVKVGQEIRLLEIPADAGSGYGMFEDIHGAADGAAFADSVREAALTYYGTPCRAYLEGLIKDRDQHLGFVKEAMETFMRKHTPVGADGQVQRVARRFSLIAAAGELGIKMGILPWPPGEALGGVGVCFHAWLGERGGTGPAEIHKGVQQVLRFLQTQANRFEDAWDTTSTFRAVNRAGFRRQVEDHWEYYVFNEVFKKEACKGFNSAQIAKALVEAGHMKGDGAKTSKTVNVPKHGRSRMYYFPALPVERDPILDGPDFCFDGE